jgi:hypothetical protein
MAVINLFQYNVRDRVREGSVELFISLCGSILPISLEGFQQLLVLCTVWCMRILP